MRGVLRCFNGQRVSELPFVKGVSLPAWCNNAVINIKDFKKADDDVECMKTRTPNTMLTFKHTTRLDGAL